MAALFRTRLGACIARADFASFHLIHPRLVRGVLTPPATALRLLPQSRAPTEEEGALTRDAPGRVSAVSLSVSETLEAFAMQRALLSEVRLQRHSQGA